jgi:argininosuccinate lyase
MAQNDTVQLRERVKEPPAAALVAGYYAPAVANGVRFLFAHEMRVHLAHVVMLAERCIIGQTDAAAITRALLDLRAAGPETLKIDHGLEDLYSYVERHIVGVLGPETGGRMHTGRSRNDLNVTSWRLALRERLVAVIAALDGLRATVLGLAHEHRVLVMPGYTHTQHAQPITLGYYLLAFADQLARDRTRLTGALAHCDRSPLGAGALVTTGFPVDRHRTAALLGFAGLVETAYDAVASRDDAHEAAAALAILMTGLSRLATDLQTWNTMEVGFIEPPDAYSSVSSIMPQKKNPQGLEFAKGAAALVTGALTAVLSASKNTAFADVNDGVTALNVPVLEACERTGHVLAVMRGILEGMTLRPERMRHLAEIGYGTATELADVVVRETGLSFRMAHNIVGRVVREAIEAGRPANAITSADLDAAAQTLFGRTLGIAPAVVSTALDPAANVASRTLVGGPAPDTVAEAVARRRALLAADRQALALRRDQIEAASRDLDRLAATLSAA